MSAIKAKGPVREHRASTEIQHRNGSRLRPGFGHSNTASGPSAHAAVGMHCTVCGQRNRGSVDLALSSSGDAYHAPVCPVCVEAIKSSAGYRSAAFHRLAQHQLYRGACHA